jgi:hypothetical protein
MLAECNKISNKVSHYKAKIYLNNNILHDSLITMYPCSMVVTMLSQSCLLESNQLHYTNHCYYGDHWNTVISSPQWLDYSSILSITSLITTIPIGEERITQI